MGGKSVRVNHLLAPSATILPTRMPACSYDEALQQCACAVVDQLFVSEQSVMRIGGGDEMQPVTKKSRIEAYTVDIDGGRKAMSTQTTSTPEKVNK